MVAVVDLFLAPFSPIRKGKGNYARAPRKPSSAWKGESESEGAKLRQGERKRERNHKYAR
jgi:hypothetical protein